MQRKGLSPYVLLLGVALVVLGLDQWSKYVVVRELTTRFEDRPTLASRLGALYSSPEERRGGGYAFRPRRHVTVSRDFLRLRYAENPGAAWGLFRSLPEHLRLPLFHLTTLGAIVLITLYFRTLARTSSGAGWARWGLALLLGGALGNYVDRIARGFVIDFIEAHWMDKASWPSFNVADIAICVAFGMLVLDTFVRRDAKEKAPVASGSPAS